MGFASTLIQIAAAALLLAALAQAAILVLSSARRIFHDRESRRLALELLRHRVKAASAPRSEQEPGDLAWNGFRKFEVQKKIQECDRVFSFYLTPHDRKRLPSFRPGQFLTFRLDIPGQGKPVIRCYSLSDRPAPDYYRVSIKKLLPTPGTPNAPPGLASSFFHDRVQEGDILDVRAPAGKFVLDPTVETPVILLAGGIGITPLLSMLNAITAARSKREIWLFLGVRDRSEHPWRDHLEGVSREHENVRLHVCYSDPEEGSVPGRDYDHSERVSTDLLKRLLPSNNYEFFLCGPPPMMESLRRDLRAWGVPDEKVRFEAFGPATVKKLVPAPKVAPAPSDHFEVVFARSGKRCPWDPNAGSLLDFALQNGIVIDSGCRAGNCGTCLTAIKSGEVRYIGRPGAVPEAGSCLTCISVPVGSLTLEA